MCLWLRFPGLLSSRSRPVKHQSGPPRPSPKPSSKAEASRQEVALPSRAVKLRSDGTCSSTNVLSTTVGGGGLRAQRVLDPPPPAKHGKRVVDPTGVRSSDILLHLSISKRSPWRPRCSRRPPAEKLPDPLLGAQDRPKIAPRGSKIAPRGFKIASRSPQDRPRSAQDRPRRPQDRPRWPKSRPRRLRSSLGAS